ncbi:MAG: ATP-grasp domain-containing protein [Gammaproteobacteria bacterium]
MRHIVIFSENCGWHEQQLQQAFAAQGLQHSVLSLSDCRLGFEQNLNGIDIPGFDNSLPAAVFVRGIPTGSFEEVTFRLDILHALQACGVPVCNSAASIEHTVDKAMTSFLLSRNGIKTPAVWVGGSRQQAEELIARQLEQRKLLVQKPLFGNCGRGLQLIDSVHCELDAELINGIYYLQQYIDQADRNGRDWRVFVLGHQAVAAMERVSPHWITNRARGGECLPTALTPVLRELAEGASRATGIEYGGVDIIRDKQGDYLVLEVNSIPAWHGLQSVHPHNIAGQLAEKLLGRI